MTAAGGGAICARTLTPEGDVRRVTIRWRGEHLSEVRRGLDAASDVCIVPSEFTLLPAPLDLHAHGGGGIDAARLCEVAPNEAEDLWCGLSAHAARAGAGAVVPALISSGVRETETFLRRAATRPTRLPGADIPGVHLEGPYLAPEYGGAHPADRLRPPDPAEVRGWLEVDDGALLMITVAPELPGAPEVIEQLAGRGRVVACGHTGATAQEMNRAFDLGAGHVIHLFNGMRRMHHRRPGPVAAALLRGGVTCELIADGMHVHPEMMRMAARLKGRDAICLVTDATAAAGRGDGEFSLGERRVTVRGGRARTAEGSMAGGTVTPDAVLRWAMGQLGWSLGRVMTALSRVPNAVIGRNAGTIETGRRADLLLVDEKLRPAATIVGGRSVSGEVPQE